MPTDVQWVIAGATLAYAVFTLGMLVVLVIAAQYAKGQLESIERSRQLECLQHLSERWSSDITREARKIADSAGDSARFDEIWSTLKLRESDDYFKLAALANLFEDIAILEKESQITFGQVVDRFGPTMVYYHGIYKGFIAEKQKEDPEILRNFDNLVKRI